MMDDDAILSPENVPHPWALAIFVWIVVGVLLVVANDIISGIGHREDEEQALRFSLSLLGPLMLVVLVALVLRRRGR